MSFTNGSNVFKLTQGDYPGNLITINEQCIAVSTVLTSIDYYYTVFGNWCVAPLTLTQGIAQSYDAYAYQNNTPEDKVKVISIYHD
ncbi:MAG: hypothetical protein HRU24_15530 [Gammaproteobacteria bacterium]|nr:hypothetical protein [Gammaproteobacteria bacterium]